MLNLCIGIILLIIAIAIIVLRVLDSKKREHWMDKEGIIKSVLWIVLCVTFLISGTLLVVSYFMGW